MKITSSFARIRSGCRSFAETKAFGFIILQGLPKTSLSLHLSRLGTAKLKAAHFQMKGNEANLFFVVEGVEGGSSFFSRNNRKRVETIRSVPVAVELEEFLHYSGISGVPTVFLSGMFDRKKNVQIFRKKNNSKIVGLQVLKHQTFWFRNQGTGKSFV